LLERGADVTARDYSGERALVKTMRKGYMEVVDLLKFKEAKE